MQDLTALCDSFKLQYEQFRIGCDAMEELGLWDKEALGEMEAYFEEELTSLLLGVIAADGSVSQREAAQLNALFGLSYPVERLKRLYANGAEGLKTLLDETPGSGIALLRARNGRLADAYRTLLFLACDILIAADGTVSEDERAALSFLRAESQDA